MTDMINQNFLVSFVNIAHIDLSKLNKLMI